MKRIETQNSGQRIRYLFMRDVYKASYGQTFRFVTVRQVTDAYSLYWVDRGMLVRVEGVSVNGSKIVAYALTSDGVDMVDDTEIVNSRGEVVRLGVTGASRTLIAPKDTPVWGMMVERIDVDDRFRGRVERMLTERWGIDLSGRGDSDENTPDPCSDFKKKRPDARRRWVRTWDKVRRQRDDGVAVSKIAAWVARLTDPDLIADRGTLGQLIKAGEAGCLTDDE